MWQRERWFMEEMVDGQWLMGKPDAGPERVQGSEEREPQDTECRTRNDEVAEREMADGSWLMVDGGEGERVRGSGFGRDQSRMWDARRGNRGTSHRDHRDH